MLLQQNPPVLNWRSWLTWVDLHNGYKTVVVGVYIFCSLSPEDLQDGIIQLRYVRFQDVSSITASEHVGISSLSSNEYLEK